MTTEVTACPLCGAQTEEESFSKCRADDFCPMGINDDWVVALKDLTHLQGYFPKLPEGKP